MPTAGAGLSIESYRVLRAASIIAPTDDVPSMIEARDLSVYGCGLARAWHMTRHTAAIYTVRRFLDPGRVYWQRLSHEAMHREIWGAPPHA